PLAVGAGESVDQERDLDVAVVDAAGNGAFDDHCASPFRLAACLGAASMGGGLADAGNAPRGVVVAGERVDQHVLQFAAECVGLGGVPVLGFAGLVLVALQRFEYFDG